MQETHESVGSNGQSLFSVRHKRTELQALRVKVRERGLRAVADGAASSAELATEAGWQEPEAVQAEAPPRPLSWMLTKPPQHAPACDPSLDLDMQRALRCPGFPYEAPDALELDVVTADLPLATLQHAQQRVATHKRRPDTNFLPAEMPSLAEELGSHPVPPDELVLTVALYHQHFNRKGYEFDLLASQTLAELRDVLVCSNDMLEQTRHMRHSAFIFIENVFYNDLRDPGAMDYSKLIRPWLAKYGDSRAEPATADMATARLEDLSLRLNYPYLYRHQGDCEHILVFKDARLYSANDGTVLEDYPRKGFQRRARRAKCHICGIYLAEFITVDDNRAPYNPCRFCKACFQPFYHTPDGQQRYDFTVYHMEQLTS